MRELDPTQTWQNLHRHAPVAVALAAAAGLFVSLLLLWPVRAPNPAQHGAAPPGPPGLPTASTAWMAACRDLRALEPSALVGDLSASEVACLTARLADPGQSAHHQGVSLVLIGNANASGDRDTWERLMLHHLRNIDASDPNFAYAYAAHLARKGPAHAPEVMTWAEVALAHKDRWSSDRYDSRVNRVLTLRAEAAVAMWQRAEDRYNAAPSDSTEAALAEARDRVAPLAREWLAFATLAEKDTDTPRQVCLSFSDNAEDCDGDWPI